MTLELPWPPSVNHYYRRNRNGSVRIGEEGKAYRKTVTLLLRRFLIRNAGFPDQRIAVWVDAWPPDKRKRDLDNLGKCLLDSLKHAGVYGDDSQIDDLRFVRMPPVPYGRLAVNVEVI